MSCHIKCLCRFKVRNTLARMVLTTSVPNDNSSSAWLVKEPGGNLDIRYILYDRDMSRRRYEELLVWASRDLNFRAVRLISIVAKRAGKRLNIDACAAIEDVRLFLNEAQPNGMQGSGGVHGDVPALFACITNVGKGDPTTHQRKRDLVEIFRFLLRAKANPYQTIHITDDQGFEARTTPREYLENILEEAKAADLLETESEIRGILDMIDYEDKTFMNDLNMNSPDIYSTHNELRFADDVECANGISDMVKHESAPVAAPQVIPRKRRESVFGKLKRKVSKGLSRI